MIALALLVLALEPLPVQCHTDSECMITDFECCGSCCRIGAYAVSRQEHDAARARCTRSDCRAYECPVQKCEPVLRVDEVVAVCRAGACQPVKRGCTADDDCVVTNWAG